MSTTMGVVRAQRAAWEEPKRRARPAEVKNVEDNGRRNAESPPSIGFLFSFRCVPSKKSATKECNRRDKILST